MTQATLLQKEKSLIDHVLYCKYIKPKSYTGEDSVEFFCHASPYIIRQIIEAAIGFGARLAEAGEFTRRAFLHGKMDLVQAEAIDDLINSKTRASHQLFLSNQNGRLSKKLLEIADQLMQECSYLELELDFSEEDVEFAERETMIQKSRELMLQIDNLIASFRYGQLVREGVNTLIVGRPNVGKSSLLNRLLQTERALVSEIPGTTRDSIEESLDIQGHLFRLIDSAGIRSNRHQIEQMGIERTEKLALQADLIIALFDGHKPLNQDDQRVLEFIDKRSCVKIALINKIDLPPVLDRSAFPEKAELDVVCVSAKTGKGINELKKHMIQVLPMSRPEHGIITKIRHKNALEKTKQSIEHALKSLDQNLSPEFIAIDLRQALDHIGTLTGRISTDDVLKNIFEKFCIGK